MPSLAIGWEYLTGYAVATDPSSRDRVEWPPHPGRVFMAMAAAWFETGEDPGEGTSLHWLEALGDPELHLPPRDHVFERSVVTAYVPVNDRAGPTPSTLQSVPSITRSKQPRTFPRVWVGQDRCYCYMIWPNADGFDEYSAALDRLCGKVTRIGHSSSLVRMWVAEDETSTGNAIERWAPAANDGLAEHHLRVVTPGTLASLPDQTQIPRILKFAELDTRIRASIGKKQKEEEKQAKAEFEEYFGVKWDNKASPPALLRPKLGMSTGYSRSIASPSNRPHAHFDIDVLVLTHDQGPSLPLNSTLAVTRALRGTILKRAHEEYCGCDRWNKKDSVPALPEAVECYEKIPPWVSGHEPSGQPLRDDDGHLACVPLPFVGREYADGHLMGVGLVFPRSVEPRERGRVLGKLLLDEKGQPKPVELKMGRLGVWTVKKREWSEPRETLKPKTWTAHPNGADTWASVTPVVLDKFPKADRATDRVAWTQEVARIIAESCTRIGLPKLAGVDVDTTSWHQGSPRAVCKRRFLRGHADTGAGCGDAVLGDGFASFSAKGTNASRPQVHVWLRFPELVVGPVLLGAGRYRGYGLCKPWKENRT